MRSDWRGIFLIALLVWWFLDLEGAVEPQPEVEAKVEVAVAAPTRHIVFFENSARAIRSLENRAGDRYAVKAALMAAAVESQAGFLAERASVLSGRNWESNWLANALFLDLNPAEVAEIAARSDVVRVVPDPVIQLDPVASATPRVSAPGDLEVSTWGLEAIKVLAAREKHRVDGSGVVVGLLDTGYEADHPALAGKLIAWYDTVDGKDEPYDDNGHGTHCAGTIAGNPTESGMEIGVAPGAKFVVGKIFSRHGSAQGSWILNGMQWIVDPDGQPNTGDEPRLVSNSWGASAITEIFYGAVQNWVRLGVFPVFAAGNAGPRQGSVGSPGAYPESFAIGATTVDTQMAQFSSRGPVIFRGERLIKPDVSAPGKDVTSAFPGGGYRSLSGTSMATPHVAGVAALLFQKKPNLDIQDIRYVLEESAVQHGEEPKNVDWGSGLVDVVAALDVVADPARLREMKLLRRLGKLANTQATLGDCGLGSMCR